MTVKTFFKINFNIFTYFIYYLLITYLFIINKKIMVEHTIRGNLLPITKVNKELYGELLDCNNTVVWRYYPKKYQEYKYTLPKDPHDQNYTIRDDSKPGDIFSVGTLLDAAGFNLDGK